MESGMVYQWTTGARIGLDAQMAGEELARIAKDNEVTPVEVVEVARPEEAPLHGYFNWIDAEAAELYRQGQARHLLNSLKVVVRREQGEEPGVMKAFVNVLAAPREEGQEPRRVYMTTQAALAGEDTRRQVLEDAMQRIRYWRRTYGEYKEFSEIISAIDSFSLEDAIRQVELTPA